MAFKKMAVDLSDAKGSLKGAAVELGIDPGRKSKWKNQYNNGVTGTIPVNTMSSDERKEVKRLQKELREAQQERDILKKAFSIFSRAETGDIQIYKGS